MKSLEDQVEKTQKAEAELKEENKALQIVLAQLKERSKSDGELVAQLKGELKRSKQKSDELADSNAFFKRQLKFIQGMDEWSSWLKEAEAMQLLKCRNRIDTHLYILNERVHFKLQIYPFAFPTTW